MIETRTTKQIIESDLFLKIDLSKENPENEKLSKVWVGLESLKKELDKYFDFIQNADTYEFEYCGKLLKDRGIDYFLAEKIKKDILDLCNSQEQKIEVIGLGLPDVDLICGKKKKCTCKEFKHMMLIENKCGRCGGEL